jgi:hypothetical protein
MVIQGDEYLVTTARDLGAALKLFRTRRIAVRWAE